MNTLRQVGCSFLLYALVLSPEIVYMITGCKKGFVYPCEAVMILAIVAAFAGHLITEKLKDEKGFK